MKKIKSSLILLGTCALVLNSSLHAEVGSLWGKQNNVKGSLIADSKAHQLGDLLTIVVNLQSSASKQANTATSKSSAVNDAISSLFYAPVGAGEPNSAYEFYLDRNRTPQMNWNSAKAFAGGGSLNNTETLVTTVQARVVDILPSGVMRVEAYRRVRASDEESEMKMVGFVRQEDISGTNTIDSSRVADLTIIQEGSGPITRDNKKGWLTKLYEFISPF
jgi:flagellar L-ring protein precursor FlgH